MAGEAQVGASPALMMGELSSLSPGAIRLQQWRISFVIANLWKDSTIDSLLTIKSTRQVVNRIHSHKIMANRRPLEKTNWVRPFPVK
jgi:hypothetical protein